MFKDIVLAITPSEICECAADTAISFAQRFDARLNLVHVCGMDQGWGSIRHLEASGETDKIKGIICEYYKDKLAGVPEHEVSVRAGMPHNEILRLVRKMNADLVVMGPHTREYADKRAKMWGMAGSTLERVSQRCPCPVMVVTRQTPYGEQTFNNVLVATDFSSAAECAVNYGGQMARQYKSKLTVFHALEPSGLMQGEIEKGIREVNERMAREFGPRLKGIEECSYSCWEGQPALEILKQARTMQADLILMAHHSKETDPENAFMGSIMAQVALNANCPVMSINKHFDMRCGVMYDQTGGVAEAEAKPA